MRKLVVSEYVTLDGVMEGPGERGWSSPFFDEAAGQFKFEELFASDALLLGRVTYEGFATAWPSQRDEAGFADRMNNMPKFVVSTTLERPAWNNTTVIRDHVAEEVTRLKEQPGQDILVMGSAQLVQTLMRHGLVDEYRLMLHPVVVGSGKRLFAEGVDRAFLKLVDTRTFSTGIVVLSYSPADAPPAN